MHFAARDRIKSLNALFAHFETAELIHFAPDLRERQKQLQQLDASMVKHVLRLIIEKSVGPGRFDDSKPCLYYMKRERDLDPFSADFDHRYISDDFQLRILQNEEWLVYDFHGHPGDNDCRETERSKKDPLRFSDK
jgi:hypothetical protein